MSMIARILNEQTEAPFLGAVGGAALLESDLFLGAVETRTDTACGVLAAEALREGVLAIRHIYVHPAYRRCGAGRAMVRLLMQTARSIGAWQVVCSHLAREGDALTALLAEEGFVELGNLSSPVYETDLRSFAMLPTRQLPGTLIPLRDLTTLQWEEFRRETQGQSLPGWRQAYNEVYSTFFYDRSGRRAGELLVSEHREGYFLERLQARGEGAEVVLSEMIRRVARQAAMDLSLDVRVAVHPRNPRGKRLIERLTRKRARKLGDQVVQVAEIT